MQEHYHRTIDQINSTIPIKKLHNLTLPFKKTLSFPLINIPPQRSQQTRSNTTNQKETYLIPSFNSSSPSAILFSSRVNVTIGRSPLRRGFEINLKKKKRKKGRRKEKRRMEHTWHTQIGPISCNVGKKRERGRERDSFSSTMRTLCVQEANAKDDGRPLDSPCFNSSWPADHRVTKPLWTRMYRVNVKKRGEIVDRLFVECVLEC